jgi:hypothetical protein
VQVRTKHKHVCVSTLTTAAPVEVCVEVRMRYTRAHVSTLLESEKVRTKHQHVCASKLTTAAPVGVCVEVRMKYTHAHVSTLLECVWR